MTSTSGAFKGEQLRYFVAVVEEGQITRAARRLHLAQPSLSQAIAGLEKAAGFKLLERHNHGVRLTAAGEQFYEQARRVVAADADASETARSLARAGRRTIAFGFLGSPPGLDSPAHLASFADRYPDIDIRYRELPFPSLPTTAWLSAVDVAVCHLPPAEADVWVHPLRDEPRVVLAPRRHRLAERSELTLEDVLGETFIGFHPSVEPSWAGFWSLDDHRGGTPERVTPDHASNPQEVLAALTVRDAITTIPASVAELTGRLFPDLAAIPLADAAPATIALVGLEARRSAALASLLRFAGCLSEG